MEYNVDCVSNRVSGLEDSVEFAAEDEFSKGTNFEGFCFDSENDFVKVDPAVLSTDLIKTFTFSNLEVAYEFYNWYGRIKGFSARRGKVRKNRDQEIVEKTLFCHREGKRTKKDDNEEEPIVREPRPETRTGCRAKMKVRIDVVSGRWRVSKFHEEHNHKLLGAIHTGMLPAHRKMTDADIMQMNSLCNTRMLQSSDVKGAFQYLRDMASSSGPIINHHNQTTIFATGVIADETEETYVWLLEQLMVAMKGKAPVSVITDGDLTMRNAIKEYFLMHITGYVHGICYVMLIAMWGEMVVQCGLGENIGCKNYEIPNCIVLERWTMSVKEKLYELCDQQSSMLGSVFMAHCGCLDSLSRKVNRLAARSTVRFNAIRDLLTDELHKLEIADQDGNGGNEPCNDASHGQFRDPVRVGSKGCAASSTMNGSQRMRRQKRDQISTMMTTMSLGRIHSLLIRAWGLFRLCDYLGKLMVDIYQGDPIYWLL
ncbi:MULE transposase domain [Sesbania bispinosa]|nr:MULE transposase domain [Sesbania bispinosa]